MSHYTAFTSWPRSGIQKEAKALIGLFFSLVDNSDPSSGRRLANEVFIKDGTFDVTSGNFEGEGMVTYLD